MFDASTRAANDAAVSKVHTRSTPVGDWGYLTTNGDLHFGFNSTANNNNTGARIATGASEAIGGTTPGAYYAIEYTTAPLCSSR